MVSRTLSTSTSSSASLEVEIENNAIIAKSCRIALHDIENNNNKDNDDVYNDNDEIKIKLIITAGNVFHPHAKISIVPPSSSSSKSNGVGIHVRIGANNLFEEESHLIIDLSQIQMQIQDGEETKAEAKEEEATETVVPVTVNAVGSYNHFAARCRVQSPQIGNANIFHPMSNIHIGRTQTHEDTDTDTSSAKEEAKEALIKNGNIFQALCCIETKTGNASSTPTDRFLALQEKVCFVLMRPEVDGYEYDYYDHKSTGRGRIKLREHRNGVKKNIQEVSMLLGTAKAILQSHHSLM